MISHILNTRTARYAMLGLIGLLLGAQAFTQGPSPTPASGSAQGTASAPNPAPAAAAVRGMVIDADTKQGVPLAYVVSGDITVRTDDEGHFTLPASQTGQKVGARLAGYRQQQTTLQAGNTVLQLKRFQSRGIYMSAYGIGSSKLRGDALALIDQTDINTLVIDVKGDAGIVPYRSDAFAAQGYPKQTVVTVHDMPAMIKELHDRGLYLIARIVTFKDDKLVQVKPQWAVRRNNGEIFKDREGLAWIDASISAAWEPAIAMAEEAAKLGFDEVQFDYVRFPDTPGLKFSQPNVWEMRPFKISAFLDTAKHRLAKYNVYVSADIFGYVCWNSNDTQIGQQLEMLSDRIDYLSPMLYPSGFTWGIPGHTMAVGSPYEIVHHSLQAAIERSGMAGVRFRPWLQAFKDYAFDHRVFTDKEIRAQIQASDAVHAGGWLLWNAGNHYTTAGLSLKNNTAARPVDKPADKSVDKQVAVK